MVLQEQMETPSSSPREHQRVRLEAWKGFCGCMDNKRMTKNNQILLKCVEGLFYHFGTLMLHNIVMVLGYVHLCIHRP